TLGGMEIGCTKDELEIFRKIGKAAEANGVSVWLVGGFVRDKLLGIETKDADFVCTGDGIALAESAAQLFFPKPKVDFFKNFGTAHFKLKNGFDLEFVGARKESYRTHSRKPEVSPGT